MRVNLGRHRRGSAPMFILFPLVQYAGFNDQHLGLHHGLNFRGSLVIRSGAIRSGAIARLGLPPDAREVLPVMQRGETLPRDLQLSPFIAPRKDTLPRELSPFIAPFNAQQSEMLTLGE